MSIAKSVEGCGLRAADWLGQKIKKPDMNHMIAVNTVQHYSAQCDDNDEDENDDDDHHDLLAQK